MANSICNSASTQTTKECFFCNTETAVWTEAEAPGNFNVYYLVGYALSPQTKRGYVDREKLRVGVVVDGSEAEDSVV